MSPSLVILLWHPVFIVWGGEGVHILTVSKITTYIDAIRKNDKALETMSLF